MKALTLHRPWSWAIAAGLKNIENRTWGPPAELVAEHNPGRDVDFIAIHSGKTWDEEGARFILSQWQPERWQRWGGHLPTSASAGEYLPDIAADMGIVAVARIKRIWTPSTPGGGVWRQERSVGWELDGVIALTFPIPCRGMQGLWPVPQDAIAQMSKQIARIKTHSNRTGAEVIERMGRRQDS